MIINMISLFGMILVVGILVDDGIVVMKIYIVILKREISIWSLDGTIEVVTPES